MAENEGIALHDSDDEIFTEESYREYLKGQGQQHNDRFRGEDETIFDALLAKEADFINTPQGEEIITAIRSYK